MKKLLCILIFISNLCSLEVDNSLKLEQFLYKNSSNTKNNKESFLEANIKIKEELENSKLFLDLYLTKSNIDKNKSFVNLKELYFQYYFEEAQINVGKNIIFWGNLEGYNFIDTFNTKNTSKTIYSPFLKEEKYGSLNINYKYFTDEGFIQAVIKLKEEESILGKQNSIYNPFSLPYNKKLLFQKKRYSPTFYLLYKDYIEKFDTDYFVKYQDGYNDKRDFLVKNHQIKQYVYKAKKFSFYSTTNINEVLYKTQASYTKSNYENVKNYYEIALGIEKLINTESFENKDIFLISEFYYNNSKQLQAFQNDLFLGLKANLNDVNNTKISLGSFLDLENKDKLIQGKFERRVFENTKFSFLYTYINSPSSSSMFNYLNSHQAFKFSLKYYF